LTETAFDASAAVGYDIARYEEMNRTWLVRDTDITYLRPLTYGDTVVVKTWVTDFWRFRLRRVYEMYLASTNEVVAQAHTDWVYLDRQSWRPLSIPDEIAAAYLPDSTKSNASKRERFPRAAPQPAGVFKMKRQVQWQDIDQVQHVNNSTYMAYLEDCGVQVAETFGWSMTRIMETGFGIVARRYRIEYKESALPNETLELATWVSDVKRATAVRHYTIRRDSDSRDTDSTLLARAHVLWVWVDLATGRPIRIPENFLADFGPNISQPSE
jgi:acyl-CoA thioester hydrolase